VPPHPNSTKPSCVFTFIQPRQQWVPWPAGPRHPRSRAPHRSRSSAEGRRKTQTCRSRAEAPPRPSRLLAQDAQATRIRAAMTPSIEQPRAAVRKPRQEAGRRRSAQRFFIGNMRGRLFTRFLTIALVSKGVGRICGGVRVSQLASQPTRRSRARSSHRGRTWFPPGTIPFIAVVATIRWSPPIA
jgi:hypothetical protein